MKQLYAACTELNRQSLQWTDEWVFDGQADTALWFVKLYTKLQHMTDFLSQWHLDLSQV